MNQFNCLVLRRQRTGIRRELAIGHCRCTLTAIEDTPGDSGKREIERCNCYEQANCLGPSFVRLPCVGKRLGSIVSAD